MFAGLSYRADDELEGHPNIVVDGSPNASTVLTLSHWPGSPTPPPLARDLSAESAFAYLDDPDPWPAAPWVTNNHFDEDGLMSIFTLVDPEAALARRERIIDIARAGDFGDWHQRDSARASMAIMARFESYEDALPRVIDLCDHIEEFRDTWAEPDAELEHDLSDLVSGRVTISENESLDLAIVSVPDDRDSLPNELAIHRSTKRFAVLYLWRDQSRLQYRYESWVRYQSRTVRPRRELSRLAERLSEIDTVPWHADAVNKLTPALHPEGSSRLGLDVVQSAVIDHLARETRTWSPR